MKEEKTAYQLGNEFGIKADELRVLRDEEGAANFHLKAAEQYLLALQSTSNIQALKTLQLLYSYHVKEGQGRAKHLYSKSSSIDIQEESRVIKEEESRAIQEHRELLQESYLMLERVEEEDKDPFNKFWDAVENLVEKISAPVAFTSQPLNELDKGIIVDQLDKGITQSTHDQSSYMIISNDYKSREELEIENINSRKSLELLSNRIKELELVKTNNDMLSSFILQFKQEYRSKSSEVIDYKLENQRLKELLKEKDLQLERLNNNFLSLQLKWDKLKDSVKKKKVQVESSMYYSASNSEV